jgi:hypothetical protein
MEASELVHSLLHGRVDRRSIRHVGRSPAHPLLIAGEPGQLTTGPIKLTRITRAHHDRGSRRYKRAGDLSAEAATSTGDEGNAAGERL